MLSNKYEFLMGIKHVKHRYIGDAAVPKVQGRGVTCVVFCM